MTVKVQDAAMIYGFRKRMAELAAAVVAGSVHYAEAVRDRAEAHIHNESGELGAHVTLEEHLDASPPFVRITTETEVDRPHGEAVEFGTSKMSARPFMRPAITEAVSDFTVRA